MRNEFARQMSTLARRDERVMLLMGDIGNRLFNEYRAEFPDRFINCGIGEANMMSMAAGLAMQGFRPYVYTITPFVTYRCYEQIRVDVCYHHQPVTIVGVGSGLGYAPLGSTHHSLEDIAVMRALPEMTVLCPADKWEVFPAMESALSQDQPTFIRLGKKNEPEIHEESPSVRHGKGVLFETGSDIFVLSCGTILPEARGLAQALRERGLSVGLASAFSAKPLDQELVQDVLRRAKLVVTIEDHSRIGGFGSAVTEFLLDSSEDVSKLLCLGTTDNFLHNYASRDFALEQLGLGPETILAKTLERFEQISNVQRSRITPTTVDCDQEGENSSPQAQMTPDSDSSSRDVSLIKEA